MSAVEKAVTEVVDMMWKEYDKDGNGYLDKEETRRFIVDTLKSLGHVDAFQESEFEEAFQEFNP